MAAVDRVIRAFLRNVAIADMEVMKRLQRWLKNILTACAIDVEGKHLGIGSPPTAFRGRSAGHRCRCDCDTRRHAGRHQRVGT